MKDRPLSGRGIVITRPREHASALAELVAAAGGDPVLFPTIDIAPPDDPDTVERIVANLERFQLAVFVSPTAATRGYALVSAKREWPPNLRAAAVGAGTARILTDRGLHSLIFPVDRADSEALAALPELSEVRGQSIVIFRGQGGREWLRSELQARGAHVEYAECYRRVRPQLDAQPLLERWRQRRVDAVSVTSTEGLEHFVDMIGETGAKQLQDTPIFVPHPRIARAAQRLGVREAVVTGHGDEQTVAAMAKFFAKV
jgi:uroporphyrinogen-III synthase